MIKGTSWNYSPISKSNKEFEEQREEIKKNSYKFINKYRKDKSFLKDAKKLKVALDEYDKWVERYAGGGDEAYLYDLKSSIDQSDPEIREKLNQVEEFAIQISNDITFFELELSKISISKQKEFIRSKLLSPYRHFLEKLFLDAKYLLSEKEEKILSLKSKSSYQNWVHMVSKFLSMEEAEVYTEGGKKHKQSFSQIISLMNNGNKKVRDSAAQVFNEILAKYSDVAEEELNSILYDKKVNDQLRGMKFPQEGRIVSDDFDMDIVKSLDEEVTAAFDVSIRYYKLKAKLFNLKKLQYHERNLVYGNINNKYSIEEAFEIVKSALGSLDPNFKNIIQSFIDNGQYDIYPKKGKRDGAFCANGLITQPTYILLNFEGKLNDVLTIAHESGHGINSELMKKRENAINFGISIATAEVASTFMEDFALQELVGMADDETKLSLIMNKLNDDISTIYRQIALYNFEIELHNTFREKSYLTKKEIGLIFQKHMKSYMGDGVEQSSGSENWWIYWSHIRTYFYVYSYASGLLISKSLQNLVRGDKKNISKVIEFLSTGRSKSPSQIFLDIGIDISKRNFWKKGLKEVEDLLEEAEKLSKKLKKI